MRNFDSRLLSWTVLALGAGLVQPTASVHGQCLTEEADKLLASDGFNGDALGSSVEMDGDVAVVGAPTDDDAGSSSGAAYVYRRTDGLWSEEQKILPNDGSASGFFGTSVDISGDALIIGTQEHSDLGLGTGAAYIFRFDGATWNEEQKLSLVGAQPFDLYGSSVAIDGDVAVVGAQSRDVGLEDDAGSAYVYRFDGTSWLLEDTLVASDAAEEAFLGSSITLDGDVVIAGAFADNDAGNDAGAAYVFRDTGGVWQQEQKLTSSDIAGSDLFGFAVDVEGDLAVIGGLQNDPLGEDRGAAYIFQNADGAWTEEAKLTASDAEAFDRFGRDVSISGDTVLVGSDDDDPGNLSGAAYLYRFTGSAWVEQAKFEGSALDTNDRFGSALAIDGDVAMISAHGDDDNGSGAGATYAFDVPSLSLEIAEETAGAGDTLSIQGCGGVSGNPIALVAVEFGGNPLMRILMVSSVGADGTWSTSPTLPDNPAFPGNTIVFELFTLDRFGALVSSNADAVALE